MITARFVIGVSGEAQRLREVMLIREYSIRSMEAFAKNML
ncbi:hypothetical protein HMPREF0201_02337 [Cedecea davisae DSM 4568]|uniref:Uncharacterized protein n=1 Tax=Cedecea davisae DSM 4568 TaxID=566551 RepID=S3IVI4_9ENTR|nr:hypothetical protein HMPREF0201_02337 [Cedecea davisae DSM 4568]